MLRAVAAVLGLVALAPPALALECQPLPGGQLCTDTDPADGFAGVIATTEDGGYVEAGYSEGTGLFGDYLYVIALAGHDDHARVHGGVGLADRDYDGDYEDGCACGAVQTPVLYVPFGVGAWDSDGDGEPDSVYIEPTLPTG